LSGKNEGSEGLRKKALRKLDRKALKRKTDVTEVWICF